MNRSALKGGFLNSSYSNSFNTTSYLGINTLFYQQAFGFSQFRKRLGLYSYKLTKNNRYKNPHAIPLRQKNLYKAQGYKGELKIRELERSGDRPFGRLTRKGKFFFNVEKVPFYNIPDLTGFKVNYQPLIKYLQLKPYVAHITPKISEDDRVERKIKLDESMLEKISKQSQEKPKGELVSQKIDPLSRLGRK